jgi:hypothetical protein
VGVTNDIERRSYEHRNKSVAGFSSKYRLDRLIYFEELADIGDAIEREKTNQVVAAGEEGGSDQIAQSQMAGLEHRLAVERGSGSPDRIASG